MKKYCFLITFCTAAVLLSGCRRDRTTTVIYTDVPSPLTQMTYSESLPPETYSEYMATYTPETESSSEERYFSMIAGNRIFADTAVTAPPVDRGESINSLKRDTAVTTTVITVTTVPDMKITNESDEIITCVPNNSDTDSTGSISELAVSETTKTTTWYTLARPEADTGISIKSTRVSTDTSITESSDTESVTESKIS